MCPYCERNPDGCPCGSDLTWNQFMFLSLVGITVMLILAIVSAAVA